MDVFSIFIIIALVIAAMIIRGEEDEAE